MQELTPKSISADQLEVAKAIVSDETKADANGVTNASKWQFVLTTFNRPNVNLFSPIKYEEIYRKDNANFTAAASFVAELRMQFLETILAKEPENMGAHLMYITNRQWHNKLRERMLLDKYAEAVKQYDRVI